MFCHVNSVGHTQKGDTQYRRLVVISRGQPHSLRVVVGGGEGAFVCNLIATILHSIVLHDGKVET